jgi:hypothetical protein
VHLQDYGILKFLLNHKGAQRISRRPTKWIQCQALRDSGKSFIIDRLTLIIEHKIILVMDERPYIFRWLPKADMPSSEGEDGKENIQSGVHDEKIN